jgi:hypothetical protein
MAKTKRILVWFGSEILRGRQERRKAKRDMKRGTEPQPRYTTGKFWTD